MHWWDSVYGEPLALQSIEYPDLWLRMADGGVTVTSIEDEKPPKEDATFWMYIPRAEPKNEIDILALDKTPEYEILSFGNLGTTDMNKTFKDVQDTKKGPLKSQLLLSSSVPPGIMDNRGHHMPAQVECLEVHWGTCVANM